MGNRFPVFSDSDDSYSVKWIVYFSVVTVVLRMSAMKRLSDDYEAGLIYRKTLVNEACHIFVPLPSVHFSTAFVWPFAPAPDVLLF